MIRHGMPMMVSVGNQAESSYGEYTGIRCASYELEIVC